MSQKAIVKTPGRIDTIIYHSPCSDGIAGAWAIWHVNPQATLVPANYGMKLDPVLYLGKTVAIVDFSFSREYTKEIASKCKFLVILDHHKSAERELSDLSFDNLEIIFDMKRSGAQIAWDYINDKTPRHWFIEMVADRDLWKWELPWSKAVGKSTFELGYHGSVDKVNELVTSQKPYEDFLALGKILLEKEEKIIQQAVAKAQIYKVFGGEFTVAISNSWFNRSEVGAKLTENPSIDFSVAYMYDFDKDEYYLSFRANEKSLTDLSIIAKRFPLGGGHKNAAGATIYGANSNPPVEFLNRKGETMYTYFSK